MLLRRSLSHNMALVYCAEEDIFSSFSTWSYLLLMGKAEILSAKDVKINFLFLKKKKKNIYIWLCYFVASADAVSLLFPLSGEEAWR